MGLARRRDAETRLTTQGLQRSSGRVIGLFDGACDRRARALDGARGRRGRRRHRARRGRARVARRLGRRRERAAVGRGRIRRAGTRRALGIRGRRGGGHHRPGAVREGGRGRRDREAAMAPRRSHRALASRTAQGASRRPMRRARHDGRCRRRRRRAGGGRRDAQRRSSCRRRLRPGRPRSRAGHRRRAPRPRWRPAAIRWWRGRRRPRACSCVRASVPFSPGAGLPRGRRPHGPAGRMSQPSGTRGPTGSSAGW